jgi:hypothetical protein
VAPGSSSLAGGLLSEVWLPTEKQVADEGLFGMRLEPRVIGR